MKRFLAVACVAMLGLSCDLWTRLDDDDDDGGSGRSGFGRWTVKTGHDEEVGKVDTTAQTTTIAALRAMKPPANLDGDTTRLTYAGSPETHTWRLTGVTLAGYKLETDGDYHLVLVDRAGNSLIAEIVDPRRAGESWKARTTSARAAFDRHHSAGNTFQTAGETVTVTGVGFFDLLHGQTGAAPNGIELHAVLEICFGAECIVREAAAPP